MSLYMQDMDTGKFHLLNEILSPAEIQQNTNAWG